MVFIMLHYSFQEFLIVTFVTLCFFVSTEAFNREEGKNVPNDEIVKPLTSCWDASGVAMVEDIPSPFNCRQFLKCHVKDVENGPEPTVMDCPPGNGKLLVYDFMHCQCDYEEKAVCYDDRNSTHRREYFRCAEPWKP